MKATIQLPGALVTYAMVYSADPEKVAQHIIDEHGWACADMLVKGEGPYDDDDPDPVSPRGGMKQPVWTNAKSLATFMLQPDHPGRPKHVTTLAVTGHLGSFAFPASTAAGEQFTAACAALEVDPSRVLFNALTEAAEATVAHAARTGGLAQ